MVEEQKMYKQEEKGHLTSGILWWSDSELLLSHTWNVYIKHYVNIWQRFYWSLLIAFKLRSKCYSNIMVFNFCIVLLAKTFKLVGFLIFWFWAYIMKLFQKRVVHTKFDIYGFISIICHNVLQNIWKSLLNV